MSQRPPLSERGKFILEAAILVSWLVAVVTVAYAFGGPAIFNP